MSLGGLQAPALTHAAYLATDTSTLSMKKPDSTTSCCGFSAFPLRIAHV